MSIETYVSDIEKRNRNLNIELAALRRHNTFMENSLTKCKQSSGLCSSGYTAPDFIANLNRPGRVIELPKRIQQEAQVVYIDTHHEPVIGFGTAFVCTLMVCVTVYNIWSLT